MSVYLCPTFGAGYQAFDTSGLPLNGGFISTFAAGTATPLSTWTTSTGLVANPTSLQLGTDGRPPNEIWLTGATTYLFQLFTSSGVSIKTYDNLYGINDPAVAGIGVTSIWAVATGTVNAITATYVAPNTALTDGLLLGIRTGGANTITTPTFAPDGLPAHTITKLGGAALSTNEWGTNFEILLRYNLASTRWELLSAAKSAEPTITTITTASVSPYLTPAGASRLVVHMTAGGGGGGGTGGAGVTGSTSTFNSTTAVGGSAGQGPGATGGPGGAGGVGSATRRFNGQGGQGAPSATANNNAGGIGGNSPFFGGGAVSPSATTGVAGTNGGGGSGAGGSAGGGFACCGGGGAGEYVEIWINNPVSSYPFIVGPGGAGGSGAGGFAGGAGGNGLIMIDEFYS